MSVLTRIAAHLKGQGEGKHQVTVRCFLGVGKGDKIGSRTQRAYVHTYMFHTTTRQRRTKFALHRHRLSTYIQA